MRIQYNKLWKILIDKNMNKVQLREAAGISSNSLAKLGKNEPVRMDVLMKIATVLNCRVEELFETVNESTSIDR
ncbi:XRE family transcriptional regulator [Corynebacterium diphtheriae]|uniref:XRE family transcriptional regulator n=1 Tax=Corynebacterium diphtheriae TaxID=1717 RepID=A0A811G2N7_CORDP|nr:helix-turn-helix transcriptional regulator [Corynebacterium diphtheriae]MBG9220919.1 helix-turn-helix transcriptional regulator [Corynebacterium diphtheriae bv. mitis]MBG9300016.1 helix-turn-helix transcriptional regulator [Corynebacterium diphtheriae bv. mitis]OJI01488.1 Cro/Cl family transcriptional regulator [Corynebacterium diphtheriae]OSQ08544.1 Cro/Cl family transcriptional regulator [Corynebacterium diphtheriae]OWM96834.1 Cro/Cl family transcriptional regulator [Corynebacterium dipht